MPAVTRSCRYECRAYRSEDLPGTARRGGARRGRTQVHAFIADDLYKRLKAYCARRGLDDGAVIEEAIKQHLDRVHRCGPHHAPARSHGPSHRQDAQPTSRCSPNSCRSGCGSGSPTRPGSLTRRRAPPRPTPPSATSSSWLRHQAALQSAAPRYRAARRRATHRPGRTAGKGRHVSTINLMLEADSPAHGLPRTPASVGATVNRARGTIVHMGKELAMKSLSAALVAVLTLGSGFATAQTVNGQPGGAQPYDQPAAEAAHRRRRLRPRRRRPRRRSFRPLHSSR